MYIIAEIGINHNGDLNLAKDMISEAKRCGANAVKFQKRDINTVYTKEFLDSPRETPAGVLKKLPNGGTTQRQQKEALEFGWDDYDEIDWHCKTVGIEWSASSWDIDSLWFVDQYNPPWHKIASPMLTNHVFISEVAVRGRKMLISTGMTYHNDIRKSLDTIKRINNDIVLMHCVSIYPCPAKLCNIMRIQILDELYGHKVGYSGHEAGIVPTLVAISMGATHIERHFTLDRSMYGSDQSASLEPKGLARIVEYAREVEECLTTPSYEIHPQEIVNAEKMRYWNAI